MKDAEPTFPLNAWYAAAYDVEVGRQLLARTVCKQKLVMFRRTDGQVAVLERLDDWARGRGISRAAAIAVAVAKLK